MCACSYAGFLENSEIRGNLFLEGGSVQHNVLLYSAITYMHDLQIN